MGFGNEDKGIGSGSDQIARLVGVALVKGNRIVVPLVQHFLSFTMVGFRRPRFDRIAT
jgi:hypothetical protein